MDALTVRTLCHKPICFARAYETLLIKIQQIDQLMSVCGEEHLPMMRSGTVAEHLLGVQVWQELSAML